MNLELFYPIIDVNIGDYSFNEGIEVEVYSSSKTYFDWAKIRFTKHFKDKIDINKFDKVVINLGYEDNLYCVFKGYITNSTGDFQDEIVCKDDMILLEKTNINNTFLDVSPQEILRFCLNKANIKNFNLSNKIYQSKKRVVISKKNIISVIKEIQSIWNIDNKFFFQKGIFYWGSKPPQDNIYHFEYAKNIIHLKKNNNLWELETVSAPFIIHSNLIYLNHPDIYGEFEVEKISYRTNDAGFIRTYIYFRE